MSKRILLSTVTGAMLVSAAVPAFAFGFGRGMQGNMPEELQEQFATCESEDRETMRECHREIMEQYREENGIEGGRGFMGRGMQSPPPFPFKDLSDEAKEQLQSCREDNEDREVAHACVSEILEANGIEAPQMPERGFGQRGGRGGHRGGFMRLAPEEVRAELKECKDLETWDEVRSCIVNALQ